MAKQIVVRDHFIHDIPGLWTAEEAAQQWAQRSVPAEPVPPPAEPVSPETPVSDTKE